MVGLGKKDSEIHLGAAFDFLYNRYDAHPPNLAFGGP